jgi:hypothetical protein
MGPLGPALALACRIVLAAVLGFAAVAKVVDRRALPGRLRAMGITPPGLATAVAIALPVVEVVVAIGLIVAAHSAVPAIVALVLLVGFTAFLLATLRRAVPCPCFGSVRPEAAAAGPAAVFRNGILLALAVIATGSAAGARVGGTGVAAMLVAAVAAGANYSAMRLA